MKGIERCGECGVPSLVSRELSWDANGVISLTSSPRNRMIFYESENIDRLFKGVEELIGAPVEHIVIESRRRETRRYIERAFPPEVRKVLEAGEGTAAGGGMEMAAEERETMLATMKAVTLGIIDIARVYGYGDQRLGGDWEGGGGFPWRTQVVRNPYSLPFIAADNLGSVEAIEGTEMRVRYEELGEDTYKVEVYPGEHPVELAERLQRRRYDFKPGDITFERCPECGVPRDVAAHAWDLEGGVITDPATGRRKAIFGPLALDAVFDDLEAELGESVPEVVIEAQRRYIRSAWGVERWRMDTPTFRRVIALRGLGDLTRFEGDREGVRVTIQNSCMHLGMVGIIQSLVELVYRVERSSVDWELAEDGDLSVTVKVA